MRTLAILLASLVAPIFVIGSLGYLAVLTLGPINRAEQAHRAQMERAATETPQ